jgi:hypothetical protein
VLNYPSTDTLSIVFKHNQHDTQVKCTPGSVCVSLVITLAHMGPGWHQTMVERVYLLVQDEAGSF